ncbi:MAG: TIGR02266 family protein [Candidatus Methylomirabilales bacterium]
MVFATPRRFMEEGLHTHTRVRRWPRFLAYLPVECTALGPGRPRKRPLAGHTQWVSAGGLGLLLPRTLPVRIAVLVRVCDEQPRRATIVWSDQRMTDLLGSTIPHGVVFEEPVDPALVNQWVYQGEQQSRPRVPVHFEVKFQYAQTGRLGHGACLNLSRGGMFIATPRPARRGTEVLLYFTLPGMDHVLSVLARVAWKREEQTGSISGMGLQFLGVNPLEAALIGAVVDRLRGKTPP